MNIENGILAFRARIFFVLLMVFPLAAHSESIMVGDIEINPQDFSENLDSEQRIAKCLSCHGQHAGGDIDFGPDVHFGTPALRGMGEQYLKESLIAYQTGTRRHKEMSVISGMLDEETMNFMVRSFAAYEAPPMKSAKELTALAEKDALFHQGQTIARQGIPQHGVPACMICHSTLGEGSAAAPRLAGQNVMYIKSQLKAFASGSRQTVQSAPMQPVVAGLTDDDIKAVAHYYELVSEPPVVARRVADSGADTIYHGGPILTMTDAQPRVEALAVADGRILAVGTKADVMRTKTDDTQIIDIAGKAIVPGFVDAHGHVFGIGLQALSANVLPAPDGEVNDIPSLQQTLTTWAGANTATVDKVHVILGFGYDDAQLAEQRHPTRDDLDAVSTDVPVYIIHQSGHLGVANSKALEVAGVSASSEDQAGGVIRRQQGSNEPSGVLEEGAHFPVLVKLLSAIDAEGAKVVFKAGVELITSYGYTTAQEGRATDAQSALMRAVADAGELDIDIVTYPDVLGFRDMIAAEHSREYRNRYRVGGAKLTIDGSPQGFTAWRDRPYYNPPPNFRGDYVGYSAVTNDQVFDDIDWAFENDVQILTHANGEAATDLLIAAIAKATNKRGRADRRPVLIHGQFMREDQIDALKKYDIFPSLFPMHTFYWGDWHRDRTVGPVNAENISPTGWIVKRGMMFSSHHDAPVAFPNSMRVLDATVTRRSRSNDIIGPAQRVDVMTALKAMTIWPAYQHFEEETKGSIEIGKLADLVILSADPTVVDPETLDQLKVFETVKEGKTIYIAEKQTSAAVQSPSQNCAANERCFATASWTLSSAGLVHGHDNYRH